MIRCIIQFLFSTSSVTSSFSTSCVYRHVASSSSKRLIESAIVCMTGTHWCFASGLDVRVGDADRRTKLEHTDSRWAVDRLQRAPEGCDIVRFVPFPSNGRFSPHKLHERSICEGWELLFRHLPGFFFFFFSDVNRDERPPLICVERNFVLRDRSDYWMAPSPIYRFTVPKWFLSWHISREFRNRQLILTLKI